MIRLFFWLSSLAALAALVGVHGHRDRSPEALEALLAQPPSRFLDLDGWRVHYRDEGSGPPLVLLHGTAANLHTWQGWTDTLAGRFRCIRVDLPGFGMTGPHPEADYRIDAYVAFLERFLDALGVDSAAVAGNSLGGEIAWNWALDHPERVRRLVLLDAAGFPNETGHSLGFRLARTPVLGGLMTWWTPKPLLRRSLEEVYVMDELVTDSLVDRYFASLLRAGNRRAFVDRVRQPTPDRTGRLGEIAQPTLLLWGAEDAWIPVAQGRRFEAAMPDAELVVYPGAGHVPQEEIPELTAATAERWLCASGW
jgi:pimeloyl-ACP methyl ester carboxylesterase